MSASTWTEAEAIVLSSLEKSFADAGLVKGISASASSDKCLYWRDFVSDKDLQKGKSFLVYRVNPESARVSADDSVAIRMVGVSLYLETTGRPGSSKTISLREAIESKAAENGFRIRFIQSGYDDSTQLYAFEYSAEKEA